MLFNNGAAPNAVLTVDFSTGHQVVFEIPDSQPEFDDPFLNPSACPSSPDCTFSYSQDIPEPSGGVLALGSAALLACVGRHRWRA